jgi:hypothetical protein
MIETNDYWILDNKLIFKPKFNESIEKYYDLISNYDTLIFSNYNDVNICIETNNKYEYNYRYEYNKSEFNKKVEARTKASNQVEKDKGNLENLQKKGEKIKKV